MFYLDNKYHNQFIFYVIIISVILALDDFDSDVQMTGW